MNCPFCMCDLISSSEKKSFENPVDSLYPEREIKEREVFICSNLLCFSHKIQGFWDGVGIFYCPEILSYDDYLFLERMNNIRKDNFYAESSRDYYESYLFTSLLKRIFTSADQKGNQCSIMLKLSKVMRFLNRFFLLLN